MLISQLNDVRARHGDIPVYLDTAQDTVIKPHGAYLYAYDPEPNEDGTVGPQGQKKIMVIS